MLKRLAACFGGQRFLRRRFERQCEHGPVTEKVMTRPEIPISPPCQSASAREAKFTGNAANTTHAKAARRRLAKA